MENIVVILSGGWVGTRFALLHKNNFKKIIITSRNNDKVDEALKCGFNIMKFDIEDESTWNNIPISPNNNISYVITFALDEKLIESYSKFWNKLNLNDKIVFCISTTSVYGQKKHSILTELSSLSGVGVTGKPLTNRIKGEEYVLTHNATVLCISGICGNETETFNTIEGSSNNYNADNTEINELMSN